MEARECKSYQCSKCGFIYTDKNLAENCCKSTVCKKCGKTIPKNSSYSMCKDCLFLKRKNDEQIRFDKANKYTYDEAPEECKIMMYHEAYGDNNGFFYELDEFLDYCVWNNVETPRYVWGTKFHTISIDATEIVENACEDLYEDAFSQIEQRDIDELQKMLDEWCKEQYTTTTYEIDYSCAIWVDKTDE